MTRTDSRNIHSHREHVVVVHSWRGHRLYYVKKIAEYLHSTGRALRLVGPIGLVNSDEYSIHLSPMEHAVKAIELPDVDFRSVRTAVTRLRQPSVIVLDGDSWVRMAALGRLRGFVPVRILVMRGSGQSRDPIARALQSMAKATLRGAARIWPRVSVFVLQSPFQDSNRWGVPDPVTFEPSSELIDDLKESRHRASPGVQRWVGVVGGIDERKNIHLIARALATIERPTVGLSIAGKVSVPEERFEDWLSPLSATPERIEVRAGLLSDVELDSIIASLDCVVIAHSNEGPSGIFAKAIAAGVPVVAAGARSLRRDCDAISSGAIWVPLRVTSLAAGIASMAEARVIWAADGRTDEFPKKMVGS